MAATLINGRRRVTLDEVRKIVGNDNPDEGILAMVDVENMGFCKDGVTRWYKFDLDGEPVIYYKF